METINIPIYRAKKQDSDEYVIGYYQTETGTNVEDKNNMFPTLRHIIVDLDKHQLRLDLFGDRKLHDDSHIREQYEIDPTTLAIHFPDMLANDSDRLLPNGKKDLRIFAQLSEDGKGGDILDARIGINSDKPTRIKTIKYTKPYRFTIGVYDIDAYANIKVIGIQK